MGYYLVIFFAASLLSLGLIFLKKPFFSLANSTTALLNSMLDTSMSEEVKQKALIQKLGKLLSALGFFVVFTLLIVGISIVPVLLFNGSGSIDDLDMESFPFYLSMILGSMVLFVVPFQKKNENYSSWSVLLHEMVLNNYNISKSLFELDKKLFKKKTAKRNENFVIVSGLARAGTTALTNLLFRSQKFHSLSYANMPFLLATNIWGKFYNPGKENLQQRAHGDKVMFGYKSVEALEEYFFKAFLADKFIDDKGLVEHEIDEDIYNNYIIYQNLIKADGADTIYLAKNNNLILRYKSLRKFNSRFKVVLLFRDPVHHAYSLMNQHKRFTEKQEKDAFILSYMNWLGHHEFGLNQKAFAFEKIYLKNSYGHESINYWLGLWVSYYTRILSLLEDRNLILVDYNDLLMEPENLLHTLEEALDIKLSVDGIVPFEKSGIPTLAVDPELEKKANDLFNQLVEHKIKISKLNKVPAKVKGL